MQKLEIIKIFYKNSKDVGMALKGQKQIGAVTQWSINHGPYIQGCRTIYDATFLHVGTMVNAPLCNSLYLFLSFLCHPYILTICIEIFIISSVCM